MCLKAAVEGSLVEYMEREYQNCARAVTKGVSLAANGLKIAMRTQVKSAGLGSRLANTWRGDVYPKAKNSVSAAGCPRQRRFVAGDTDRRHFQTNPQQTHDAGFI